MINSTMHTLNYVVLRIEPYFASHEVIKRWLAYCCSPGQNMTNRAPDVEDVLRSIFVQGKIQQQQGIDLFFKYIIHVNKVEKSGFGRLLSLLLDVYIYIFLYL